MLNLRHRLEFLVFQAFVCIIDSLSVRTTARLANFLATLIHFGLPRKWTRYAVARDNLNRAFGGRYSEAEIENLVYEMWVHLFRTVAETVQAARKLHIHSYREIVDFAEFTRTNEAICSGRRVLMGFPWGLLPVKWTTLIYISGSASSEKIQVIECC